MSKMKKILALVLSVLLVAGLLTACGGEGPEKVAVEAAEAIFDAEGGETLVDLMPDAMIDAMIDEGYYDSRDDMVEEINAGLALVVGMLGDAKVTAEATDVTKWDKDEIQDYNDALEDAEIDMQIKDGADVEVELTLSGGEVEEAETQDLTIPTIKVGNKWYVDFENLSLV